MFERFTDRARRVVVLAQEEARRFSHNYIDTEHILLGLIHEGEGVAAKALESLGISLDAVRQQVEEIIGQGQQAPSGHIPLAPETKKAFELSLRQALHFGDNYIGTEHILLGLIYHADTVAGQVLVNLGTDLNRVREEVIQVLHRLGDSEPQGRRGLEEMRQQLMMPNAALDKFCTNILASAPNSFSGRENELSLTLQVLSRRTRNNPVLVGESTAEKTALVEALAKKLRNPQLSRGVSYKGILKLNHDVLTGNGLPYLGSSLKQIFKELEGNRNAILFINDLPAYLTAQNDSAAVEAASILRQALARGRLQLIGTATAEQYRRFIEPNALLSRHLQPVYVADLNIADVLAYLWHLRAEKRYKNPSNITITDDALVAAATLAKQYSHHAHVPTGSAEIIDRTSNAVPESNDADQTLAASAIRIVNDALQIAVPTDARIIDEKIVNARREQNRAIVSQDFERVAEFRDQEKELLRQRQTYKAAVEEIDEPFILDMIETNSRVAVSELRKIIDDSGFSQATIADSLYRYQPYVLLNDRPLVGVNDDLLGTDNVAAGIASLLAESRPESPFVVGIDAGWGMGKSSLLRQIESRVADVPGVATVRFNAWTAEGKNALEGLIKSVLVQLDKNVIRRCLRRLVARRRLMILARIGIGVIMRFLGITRLVDELWNQLSVDARTRNQMRDLIQGMLSEWVESAKQSDLSRALVVFIDDLDRCTDEVVVQVCEAVKLYLDAPGLVFVIACDLSVIARSVSASARGSVNEGRTYLEKIVQVIYHLPPPDEGQLGSLIAGYALRSGTAALIDKTVTKILVESAGRNPRRIKRIINSVVLENQLNPAWSLPPLNRAQLVTAILLQHLYSSFYDLMIDEASGEDPIGDFLNYVDIREKALNPPPPNDDWWSNLTQTFERYKMRPPEISQEQPHNLRNEIERLENQLPENFPTLAHSTALIALLRGVGDSEARIALRSQLMRRPLTTEAV